MSARIDTTYTCDGCGKTERGTDTGGSPYRWIDVSIFGGPVSSTKQHACSKPCLATALRKLSDQLDGVTPGERQFFGSNGGPYR